MKKLLLVFLSLTITAGTYLSAQNPGPDEILAKYFETIGQENLLKVQTLTVKGNFMQMGMELPYKIIQKRPAQFYLEIEIQGAKMKQAYDGVNGWMLSPMSGSMEPNDITGPELKIIKEQADIDGYLWKWKEMGFQLELVGTEEMEGSKVYNLKLTKEGGDIDNFYIDADNYVLLKLKNKIIIQGTEMEQETLYSNYKPVKGYLLAHNMDQRMNGQTMTTITVSEVLFDEPVSDSLFVKPVAAE